ncbi:MAG: SpoIIE family protein phosphatase [Spirochaetes bacterium]|nr:SpoIIE family protein phosphatase [Spirochaetota bacterium]
MRDDVIVEDLLRELNENPSVPSVGVIDGAGTVAGIVTRDMFFDILGRPFGRDLYKNKMVRTIMMPARQFLANGKIFTIADELEDDLRIPKDLHYVIIDDNHGFAGIFTNRDLLVYLSEISRREIDFAKSIQSVIVPEETLFVGRSFKALAATAMAKEVGGDYYCVKKIDDSNWFFSICDVSGKGISAALLSVLMGGINYISDFSAGIREYVMRLNQFIFDSFMGERFMTGVFAMFSEETRKMIVYDAGHSLVFLWRSRRLASLKSVSQNIPLGIDGKYQPACYTVALMPGDMMIMITDGIEGQSNQEGERFGVARLHSRVRNMDVVDIKKLKDEIFQDIGRFRGHQAQDDDMTMLLLAVE